MATDERITRLPVALLAMPAARARAGRVAWVHRQYEDTFAPGLVGYEGPHLVERPPLEPTALSLASRRPVPNPCKMLADDGRPCVFGLGDQSVAHPMVLIRPHTGFPQADFPQFALRTFGPGTLAGTTHARIPLTAGFYGIAAEGLPVIV